MKFRLDTKDFVGYFDSLNDLLDFMSQMERFYKWTLTDEVEGKVLMTGGLDADV